MRSRRGPQFASLIFTLIVVLAVGALAWGATHGKSTGHGVGSAKDQAAARTTLLTGLQLPAGLARDPSFTACGNVAVVCLTGSADVAHTLTALTAVVHSAGGSLPDACTATITSTDTSGAAGPRFTCAVDGTIKGAEVFFMLGGGWLLPGHPTPRTAVLATVMTSTAPPVASPGGAVPGTAADAASLLPSTWASAPQPCAGGPTAPALSSAPGSPTVSAATASPLVLPTLPPLPPCSPGAITVNVGVHLALATAASQLSDLALSKGFRIDGRPCIAGSTPTSCGVWGERISSGLQELFVATLTDDGRGDTTGTLAVTQQSLLAPQGSPAQQS